MSSCLLAASPAFLLHRLSHASESANSTGPARASDKAREFLKLCCAREHICISWLLDGCLLAWPWKRVLPHRQQPAKLSHRRSESILPAATLPCLFSCHGWIHTCDLSLFIRQPNFQNFKLYAEKCVFATIIASRQKSVNQYFKLKFKLAYSFD